MPRSAEQLLRDVVQANERAQRLISGIELAEYSSNDNLRLAIERLLEIVGEALRQLRDEDPVIADKVDGLQSFVSLRHVIAHRYAVLEDEILWTTARNALPRLSRQVTALLGEMET